MDTYRPELWRSRFPALSREIDGRAPVHLDGPAGSQVPDSVIDAVSGYLTRSNANGGGVFASSVESDSMLREAHIAAAQFVGSDEGDLVIFGPNMTTLTVALARALGAGWGESDEILVTHLEHDANFTPWLQVARDSGATVREVGIRRDDCTLDLDDLRSKLSDNTRLLAIGAASNVVGTINPLREIVEEAHAVGALVFVDAVHYAPHGLIDVEDWGCDFVVCSAYKFFGPHVGFLWGRRDLLMQLPVYKLRPAPGTLPERWMPGTQNHEGIAGTLAAIDYLAELGRTHDPRARGRREALAAAFEVIGRYERGLSAHMLETLGSLEAIRVWGIADPARLAERVPTFSFTHSRHTPREMAIHLARRGIFVWDGNFYGLPVTQALGLEPDGTVRAGLLHYNTTAEIDRLGAALAELT